MPINVSTLETGRLFAETVALIAETEERFDLSIKRYVPEQDDIDAYAAQYGLNGFYESVEARHACCHVRKLKPLAKALEGAQIWITGLRRGQSGNRATTPFAEYDADRNLLKINPLADWSLDQINAYVEREAVPVNPLHARGYLPSAASPVPAPSSPASPSVPVVVVVEKNDESANAVFTSTKRPAPFPSQPDFPGHTMTGSGAAPPPNSLSTIQRRIAGPTGRKAETTCTSTHRNSTFT